MDDGFFSALRASPAYRVVVQGSAELLRAWRSRMHVLIHRAGDDTSRDGASPRSFDERDPFDDSLSDALDSDDDDDDACAGDDGDSERQKASRPSIDAALPSGSLPSTPMGPRRTPQSSPATPSLLQSVSRTNSSGVARGGGGGGGGVVATPRRRVQWCCSGIPKPVARPRRAGSSASGSGLTGGVVLDGDDGVECFRTTCAEVFVQKCTAGRCRLEMGCLHGRGCVVRVCVCVCEWVGRVVNHCGPVTSLSVVSFGRHRCRCVTRVHRRDVAGVSPVLLRCAAVAVARDVVQ